MNGRLRNWRLRLAVVVALALIVALALVSIGLGNGASSDTTDSGCDHWCGNGSATVTMGGVAATINGGGCYDMGAAGVDVRFGDWQGLQGLSSYLMLVAYRAGGPTAAATPAANPSDHPMPKVDGSVNGTPFTLGPGAIVTLSANGIGSFSGTDVNGYGAVKGTFTCG
jgi:hypothetical protein